MPDTTRWHPLTRATLMEYGFTIERHADMKRGNWRIWPEKDFTPGDAPVTQYPLTLEHEVRGVCLKIYEPPMLDLLRMLG